MAASSLQASVLATAERVQGPGAALVCGSSRPCPLLQVSAVRRAPAGAHQAWG